MLKYSTNLPSVRNEKVSLIAHFPSLNVMYRDPTTKCLIPVLHVEGSNTIIRHEYLKISISNIVFPIDGTCVKCGESTTYIKIPDTVDYYRKENMCCDTEEDRYTLLTITQSHRNMIVTAGLGLTRLKAPPIFYETFIMINGKLTEVYYYIDGRYHLSLTRDDHDYIVNLIKYEAEIYKEDDGLDFIQEFWNLD